MSELKLRGVEDTLFIPLAARVLASKEFPQYFYDEKSLQFKELEQIKSINSKSSEYSMLASVSRYFVMDEIVKSFMEKNENAVIVNLGVGLETMNYRLKSYKGHFVQVDFPAVMEARQHLLGKADNETILECDVSDFTWANEIDENSPVLLVASGVFQYFKPETVSDFIKKAKDKFNNAELLFDVTDEVGIKYAQRYVKKTGNQSAMMYFFVNDPKEFCKKENIELILERGFFAEARKQLKGLKLYTKIAIKVVEDNKRVKLIHSKL
ncbi:MAG: class I SAM-dependent methyltransferase [Anaerovoracaceae bacterium]